MKVYFHPEALVDLSDAIAHYEESQKGLGLDLANGVMKTISRICQHPEAWTALSSRSRRCLVGRFPYGVIYQVQSGVLRIISVAHLRRRPNFWVDRV